ncbi:glyoxalase [Leptospira weilii serovar Heyan]|uniref:Glyoxalase-like domain protein n=1 Tax=Leptospira weilii str. UI 13098 TaxID=1088542 RepID=M6PYR5_9LEPT|nr:glyoxalase-like domain protein [Leptospira weilii str. UI 13098]OMI19343.1 glyoxalase [Leptospira weilii serovar Heyan]
MIAKAEKAGAKIVKRPQDVFWGGYFEDPEGYYWEVAWNPGFYPGPKSEN